MGQNHINKPTFSESNNKIESVLALFRNFSPAQPIENAVLYFWESHTEVENNKKNIQACIDLIRKEFNLSTCEKYEVRTGYLSRFNYLERSLIDSSEEEIQNAIEKGKSVAQQWVEKCDPLSSSICKKGLGRMYF